MIKFFKSFFKVNRVSAIDKMIVEALGKANISPFNIKLWHQFIYDLNIYKTVNQKIINGDSLDSIKALKQQDLQRASINLYYVNTANHTYIVSVFDPYDYLEKEKVMDVTRYDEGNHSELEILS